MQNRLAIDPALLRRYDGSGPRYTSYPTALEFRPDFDTRAFAAAAAQPGFATTTPLSFYVHVPYCFSPCFYCGCNRTITRRPERGREYLALLKQELALLAPYFAADRQVVQLHFGGGTPNFLDPEQLGMILAEIARSFALAASDARDISIELDPRSITPAAATRLVDLGFNRASIGVQDFDPVVQAAINRRQTLEETAGLVHALRRAGIRSVNIDLVYGLPHQTPTRFAASIETVLELAPDRIALYGYAHLPQRFKAQRQIPDDALPGAAARLDLFTQALAQIDAAGYEYIGMDHFALPGDDLVKARAQGQLKRNFMGYSTHAGSDLIGLGASAISHIGNTYSQNAREIRDYATRIDAGRLAVERGLVLGLDDLIRASLIQALMCYCEVDWARLAREFRLDVADYFADELVRLQALVDDGLVRNDHERLHVLPSGRLLLRNIAMCFDHYLHQARARPAPHYSRTV